MVCSSLSSIKIKDSLPEITGQESVGAVIGSTVSYLNIVEFQFAKGSTVRHFFPWPESQQNLSHFSNYNTKITTSGVRSAEFLALGQVHALGWSHSNSTCKWIWKQQSTSLHKCVSIAFGSPEMWIEFDILLREKRLSTQERSCGHVFAVGHASFTHLHAQRIRCAVDLVSLV